MRDRWIGMLLGVGAVAVTYGLTRLPYGWIYLLVLVGLSGWIGAGCVSRLRRLTEQDQLTGLANRRAFERALTQEWVRAQRYRRPLSILFIDLDDFGLVNKKHGHLMGDHALRWICRLLSENIRETDLVVRWGGEEFAILLPETDLQAASALAERLRSVVEQSPMRDRNVVVSLTLSTGVASWPGMARSPQQLLRQAIKGQAAAKMQKNAVGIVS